MGQSVFVKVMLFVIAVILLVGFYLLIDAVDVFRLREEVLVREIQAARAEVTQLRKSVEEGRFTVATSGDVAVSPARPKFANEEIRDPDAEDGDAIITTTQSETANLNSIINNESQVADFWSMTYDALATRNLLEPDRFEPLLAERWEISDDKMAFTIHLRKGVLWHDFTDPITGKRYENVEVTAEDFKFYIDVIRNPKIPCTPIRNYFKDLKGIKVLDKYTFQVLWKERYFRSVDLTLGLTPLPRHFYQFPPDKPEDFTENFKRNRMIVGCGPWIFEQWEKGKAFYFRRNENYYGLRPHLKRRIIKVIKEPNARLLALRNGQVDRVGLQPEQWMDQTSDAAFKSRFNKFRYYRRVYYYIGYNLRLDLFKDRRVRVALTHLVDRQRIIKDVLRGLGRVVTGNFYIDSPYYDKAIQPYPFDIPKAKALLGEAGWRDTDGDGILDKAGKKFEFAFTIVANSKTFERVAEIVQDDFAKAGIVVNVIPLEWSVYTQRMEEANFEVCALGWAMGWEADPYQLWHSSEVGKEKSSNHIGFKNAEADSIIMTARREFDLQERIKLYQRFHRLLHEEQPYTFLFIPYSLVAQDKRFRNAKVYPIGGMDIDSFWVPENEQKYRD